MGVFAVQLEGRFGAPRNRLREPSQQSQPLAMFLQRDVPRLQVSGKAAIVADRVTVQVAPVST
jgi:hypothetical protein